MIADRSRGVRPLQPEVENITRKVLDDVTGRGECDFVTEVSSKIPLAVIAELLGVPHQDWEQMFQWTNETIGSGDPEFQRIMREVEGYWKGYQEQFART